MVQFPPPGGFFNYKMNTEQQIRVIYFINRLPHKLHKLTLNTMFLNEGFHYKTYTRAQRRTEEERRRINHVIANDIYNNFQELSLIVMATPNDTLLKKMQEHNSLYGYRELIDAIEKLNERISETEENRLNIHYVATMIGSTCLLDSKMKNFCAINDMTTDDTKQKIVAILNKYINKHANKYVDLMHKQMHVLYYRNLINTNTMYTSSITHSIEECII